MNLLIVIALLGCQSRNSATKSQAPEADEPPPAPKAAKAEPPPPPPPPPPEPEAPNGCVTWVGEPVALSPDGDEPRHHATIAWSPDGGLLAAWQVGKDPARVVTRAFDASLAPLGDEVVASGEDRRATHPALAAHGEQAMLVWTREDDGALRRATLDGKGKPTGAPTVLAEGRPAPARYGDVSYAPTGDAIATWFADREGAPTWPYAAIVAGKPDRPITPTPLPGTNTGGPGTVRHDPSGAPWAAWFELAAAAGQGGEATLRVARLGAAAPEVVHDAWRTPENLQRTSLAFVGDRVVVGWTRYPTRTASWAVGLTVVGPDGRALPTPGAPIAAAGARMLDLDAAGGVVVAGWEAPNLGQDRELWLQAFDADGKARCSATLAHRPHPDEDARAQILLRDVEGGVRGVVTWQRGPHARKQTVWARAFALAQP